MEAPRPTSSAAPDIRSISGVFVEASGKTTTLAQALQDHLIQPDVVLALLEAQAATGGIVDPVGERLLPVAEALAVGLAGLEMKEKLLRAERAVTGFPDPYTEEKVSLYQAIQKELIGRKLGLCLLEAQIATGGVIRPVSGHRVPLQEAYARGYLDEGLSNSLSDPGNEEAKGFRDPNTDQMVTYTELMRRCVADPARGLLLLPLKISFPGLRGAVCSQELLDSGVIDAAVFEALQKGEMTVREVAEMDSVQLSTSEIASIAGVAVLSTNECKSLYQALVEHLLPPGAAEILLQAQVASGYLIDPVKNAKFTVAEAVQAGVVGPELFGKLTSAERAVTGYKDPYTGETISLFQAMQKHLVPRNPGLCLLDAQLATGGVIDPEAHHRLPARVALQRGHLDEETYSLLCNPMEKVRGFFEPNSQERLSYGELLLRCVSDPDTGLCLLPLSGNQERICTFIDHNTKLALKNTMVSVASGRFKGRPVSLWKLLFSEYLTGEQRRTLTQQFSSGSLSAQQLADKIRLVVEQTTADSRVTFEGLREKVTPAQLLSSEIINRDLFEKLTQGETLVKEVINMGTVKKYLEGTGSIGGLLLPNSQERMSIYEAKRKGLLRPGTALILLEAQAATGHIIDPVANQRYSVDDALRGNIIGPDMYSKLLAAEKAVTGYKDPYTGNKISLFQAMKKDLIVKEHAIRLLEAQIATGGIIDPVNSHRLPVEVAYKRGFFEKKMSLILSDPSDDTKGFFDPNTHENLTYLQLKEKCIVEPTTGLCLLPLNSKKHQPLDDATKQAFRSSWLFVKHGRFQGQRVSLWDLLNSEYFSEGKRKEVFNHYRLRKVTLEEICLALEEEMKKWACIQFPALRGKVSAYHLLERGIIDRALFEEILDGGVRPEDVLRLDSVRRYLYGTGSIGGILLQPSNERLSLYEAMKRDMVVPGVALPLLEAQAATGFLVDPVSSQRLSLDDAVKKGLVGPELYEVLQQAEEAVTGYRDPFTGKIISLFQAMKKGLLADRKARQMMDAQLATGGVMDPHSGHYVPIEFAQKNGYLDEEFRKTFSNPSSDSKAFSTLDKKERVSYGQLMDRCLKEAHSDIRLLPLAETASARYTEEQIQQRFKETFVEDKGVSLWDLLSSSYFTEEQKSDFLEKYSSGAVSLHQLVSLVQEVINDIEMKAKAQVTFQGLRGAVPAVWLLDAGIISEKTFAELAQGKRSPREVSEMESVKLYLQGTGSIAGVFVQSSKEKMGIYQAMQERLLLPGVAAQLLSAQAATGSIMDPASNRRFGVEDAIKSGIVGEELMEELLQAEKAVSGFPDPYSGKPISVCQAIRKELLPARVGIPMLEAQLATGGIIDPVHCHHLPLRVAFKHGLIDEEMQRTLSQDSKESQVFFDPNAQESLTYQQLKDRCIQDPEMGLWLLPLSKEAAFYGDQQAMEVLKSFSVSISTGRFKGQDVSLWDLLHSEYIPDAKRRELVLRYKETHEELLQEMASSIKKIIEETEQQGKRFTFEGLRKKVSASDLFQSQLIDMTTLDELRRGKTTVQEVSEMDSVKRFLEGCNFIAGVLIEPDREKMSLYQAMRQGLLRPGAALVLLEAQAATGYLIDPVKNKKLSVDEAVSAGLIGREIYEKLLSAEKAVTGYTDPYTKGQISLFEAMNQELIVRSHGIRLLEAQIATGGIIDPVHSHRIPVEVAYKRGYFDEDLNCILLDPTDDTKGFFDPNTHENLTYLQLLERCIQDSESGLYMLQIVRRGDTYFYIDEATKEFLRTQTMKVQVGRYKDQVVSVWSLLCSPYIQEQKRKDLVRQYKSEKLSLPQLCKTITTIVEETEQATQKLKLKGLRGQEVSAAELFNAEIIDKVTLDRLHLQTLPLPQLAQRDIMKRYLEGTGCIAGVLVAGQGLRLLTYEALKRGFLSPEHALLLLEAQAATGLLTDLVEKKAFSVDQAISLGLVGEEFHKALLLAEKAVIGYTDPSTGDKVSLFQAMKRNLVEKAHALRLLEAQMATGGIIDPMHSHRLPVEVACRRGYLDEETFLLLSDEGLVPKGFVDPNTQERISYTQLLLRCIKDSKTGAFLLPLLEKREYMFADEKTKCVLSSCKIKVGLGKYKGQPISLWELLSSDYVTKEMQKEMIKKYKEGGFAVLQSITAEILKIIEETEDHRKDIWFQGLRRQVTASELLKADIINEQTMKNLQAGKETAQVVAKIDSVKRYLEGTNCIAGVMVPSRTDPSRSEKMTIYQAMWKGILRPGTALVLLEAQAATGFIINPSKNERLSVSQAVEAGVVGEEIQKKLLCAERAVTGYTDPNTGKSISLFQAMKKEIILKEHGIRLLEAQIATGGIIDPVHSHRLPVEVAYKRGYFDEEMNQILSDPTDDTKGFFDPNTHENLTYLQLLQRCLPDPETGLLLLHIMDKGCFSSFLNENTRKALQEAKTKIGVGLFQDQEVSAWDLLFSRYILPSKRQDLLRQYKAGTVTLERLTQVLIAIVTEAEEKSARPIGHKDAPNQPTTTADAATDQPSLAEPWMKTLESTTVDIPAGDCQGQRVTLWDLLFSNNISEEKRTELLDLYKSGLLSTERLTTILHTLVVKKEATSRKLDVKVRSPAQETAPDHQALRASSLDPANWESALRSELLPAPSAEQKLSAWDILFSERFAEHEREELLSRYRRGSLPLKELTKLLIDRLPRTTSSKRHLSTDLHTPSSSGEAEETKEEGEDDAADLGDKEEALKSRMVEVTAAAFHGRKVSVWEVLHSKYIPEEKRKELLQLYQSGILTIDQMETVVSAIVNKTEEMKKTEPSHAPLSSGSWEDSLRNQNVTLQVGELQGQRVSLWELLFSQSIPESQREELLMKYRLGSLTIQEMITTLTSLHAKDRASSPGEEATLSSQHNELECTLRQVMIDVPVGEFQGSRRSAWELLFSKYVTGAKRQELLQKYQERTVAPGELVQILITLIEEMEEKGNQLKFSGLRKQVSASELFDSRIINQDTLSELAQGTKTVEEVTEMDLVKRYLEGNSCIAGVMVPSRKDPSKSEKMTIYQAMWKGILRPGTALVLLEAQAATGFVTDPLGNKKLSVDDAVSVELVGAELREKLLSAERAVTGYKDPYTGNKLSLFQAMKKGLIVKEHGIRLLEAQIATGGIIDPVHSHRLPVEVAYKRGYFDEEMNQILSDPTDDTKGFFDPNTHENLTYLQLLQRCLPDPETGLLLLHIMDKGCFSSFLNENTRKALQEAKTKIGVGLFQDQEVSAWDLLFSRYILPSKRQDLLRQYKAGTVTLERLTQVLIAIVTEAEEKNARPIGHKDAPNQPTTTADAATDQPSLAEPWMKTLESTTVDIPAGDCQGQRVTLWDLLFSNNISEEKRTELLDLYKSGLLSTERLTTILHTLVVKKEATSRKLDVKVRSPAQETAPDHQALRASSLDPANWESALRSELLPAPSAEQKLSAWDILFSERFAEHEREELLSRYRRGSLPLKELTKLLIDRLPRTTSSKRHLSTDFHTPSSSGEAEETKEEGEDDAADLGDKEEALKSRMVEVTAAAFHGRKVSVWEVLHSKYIPEEKRKELLQLYQSGILTIDQMETVVSAIVNKTEEMKKTEPSHAPLSSGSWEDPLRNQNVTLQVGELQGQRVSLWELLFSQSIPESQREELLMKYRLGSLTIQEMITTLTSLHAKDRASSPGEEATLSSQHNELERTLRQVTIDVPVGEFQGSRRSAWELLFSKYVTGAKRQELLQKYQERTVAPGELVQILITLIEEMEEKGNQLKFSGLRKQVSASELFDSRIINQDTLSELAQGTKTVEEVTEMDSVKRYLEGNSCIAGVMVPSRKDPSKSEKMTIYQAMWKGILRPGTALVLLEAQAATGFITDPLGNKKLSVDDAVSVELVGAELWEKLLSAERAVTGYKDPYTGNKLSLFQAMKKGLIVKEHGIRLLEAQIATGGIIDPVHSHRLPVEVAYKRGYFDEEMNQILSDPTDDTKGFFDPNTHENLTYLQLLQRCLPDPETGLLLLHIMDKGCFSSFLNENTRKALQEAKTKIGVGLFQDQEVSAWDLLFSRYILLSKRQDLLRQYKAGTVTLERLTQVLIAIVTEAEEKSARPIGHKDAPNQPTTTADAATDQPSLAEPWMKTLESTTVDIPAGDCQGQRVTLWDLLFSNNISEEKRTELLDLYKSGLLSTEQLTTILHTLVVKKEATSRKLDVKVRSPAQETAPDHQALRASSLDPANWESALRSELLPAPSAEQKLSAWDILFSERFAEHEREELLSRYRRGSLPLKELTKLLIDRLPRTTSSKHHLSTDLHTPSSSGEAEETKEEGEDDAADLGDKEEALKSRMVEVTAAAFHGRKVSVWEVLHSKYIPEEKRKELLQLYQSGILTIDQMETVVSAIVNKTEEMKKTEPSHAPLSSGSWEDPLRNQNVTLQVGELQGQRVSLWELLFSQSIPESQREELLMKYRLGSLTIQEMITTLTSLHAKDRASSPGEEATLSSQHNELERTLRQVMIDVPVGEFQGSRRSAWELLFSKYVTGAKRQELLQKYQERTVAPGELVQILITLIEEMEEKGNQLKFSGLRKQVSASELFDSRIINQDTLSELAQGTKTVEEVTEMDSVKRYLEGNSCIAGVMVPSRKDPSKSEKMTIYQAMWKGILRPGTALVLLEAQAATGFITDPLGNKKLSVDDAVSVELVGAELREKLLSAERAVTGYKDPYTGNKLSLFQAMKKGLIVKEHGIRLLEAQIATGGIIDPVHSHRLPVEVAYKRGYFDEEMNQILSDPTDDTKGFFDPNTHENLTYLQLLQRCLPDPETGLLLLHIMDKGCFSSFLNENTRKALQEAKTKIGVGLFQDQEVSAWDLLFSRYILPSKRQDLLRQYKAGTVTLERLTQVLIAIVTEAEEKSARPIGHKDAPNQPTTTADAATDQPSLAEPWMKTLESTTVDIPAGDCQGQRVTLWDLLFSNNISEEKRTELLDLYKSGLLSTERLTTILHTLVVKKEATSRKLDVKVRSPAQETAPDHQALRASSLDPANWESALRSELLPAPSAEQKLSAWDILFSERFAEHEREELLSRYRRGSLPLKELTKLLIDRLPRTTSSKRHLSTDLHTPSSSGEAEETKEEGEDDAADLGDKEEALKSRMVEVTAAAFHGRKVSVWEVLHSKYIPEEKRKELLQLYQSGILTIDQMETVVSAIVNKTEEMKKTEPSHAPLSSGSWEDPLRNQNVTLQVGELQGQRVSLWELLFSQSIPESQREELLMKYRLGSLTIQEMITTLTSLHAKDRASSPGEEATLSSQHNELERTLRQVMIDVPVGEFQGSRRSAWELLFSKYVTGAKRQELLQKYQERTVAPGELVQILITLIEEMEEKGNQLKFSGLRKQVSASELFDSRIINQDTLSELAQGTKTVEEVTEMDSVKRYLEGNSCIAGVMVPSRKDPSKSEKMTIYQAMWKGILRPGTALVLLEAQAATGFITDPLGNKKLSVDDAVSVELVGAELREKFLSAERAVTGYKDPYTGNKLSLFQAMKKGLIVKEHGIRLLEAQIATGGIIDPVHSHRLPVEVAYKRGYFDEEMNQILSDPTDDTKGFFDPNTHENLTYLQLLQRCLPDPETGLLLLHIMDKGCFSSFLNENTRKALQEAKTKIGVGLFQDQEVSAWDLLFSRYILPSKRQDLLRQYKAGTVTLERLTQVLIAIVTEAEEKSARPIGHKDAPNQPTTTADAATDQPSLAEPWMKTLESTTVDIPAGDCQGQRVTLWDLLFSNNISEEKRTELLDLYKSGLLSTERLTTILHTLVVKKEATSRKLDVKLHTPSSSGEAEETKEEGEDDAADLGDKEEALKSRMVEVTAAAFHGRKVSVWEVLHSKYIPEEKRKELLQLYQSGILTIDQMETVVSAIVNKTEEMKSGNQYPSQYDLFQYTLELENINAIVRDIQEQKTSVWDPFFSRCVSNFSQEISLLESQGSTGTVPVTAQGLSAAITQMGTSSDGASVFCETTQPYIYSPKSSEESLAKSPFHSQSDLKSRLLNFPVAEFPGKETSLWDVLHSHYVSKEKQKQLLRLHQLGNLTLDQMESLVTDIIHRNKEGRERPSGGCSASGSPDSMVAEDGESRARQLQLKKTLRTTLVPVTVGEYKGQCVCVLDLLFSKYVPQDNRQELLELYREGALPIEDMVSRITVLLEEAESQGEKRETKKRDVHRKERQDQGAQAPLATPTKRSLSVCHPTGLPLLCSCIWLGTQQGVTEAGERRGRPAGGSRSSAPPPRDPVGKEGCAVAEARLGSPPAAPNATLGPRERAWGWSPPLRSARPRLCPAFPPLPAWSSAPSVAGDPAGQRHNKGGPGAKEGGRKGCVCKDELESLCGQQLAQPGQGPYPRRSPGTATFQSPGISQGLGFLSGLAWGAGGGERGQQQHPGADGERGQAGPAEQGAVVPPSEQKQSRDRRPEPRNSLSSKARRGALARGSPPSPCPVPAPGNRGCRGRACRAHPRKRPGGARAEGPLEMEVLGTSPAAFPPEVSPGRRPARLGTTSRSARSVTRAGRGALFFRIGGGGGGAPREGPSVKQSPGFLQTLPMGGGGLALALLRGWPLCLVQRVGEKSVARNPARWVMAFRLTLWNRPPSPARAHRQRQRDISIQVQVMPGDKRSTAGSPEGAPIMQVREEAHWPFPNLMDPREDQVIAGILKEPGRERLSIRQALHRGLLTHGTGLALLEHQAASGYIVDCAKNRLLSVRDARNAGLLDRDHFNTLLIAEKAVTGYTDPFSGNKISLFQAMRKGLLIKDHGIRLLEAQVATGGLIHPMHSHRLPVEVAYKWGYLDAEIFHLISNPSNHTKRCFDPNARENLTYLQLLPRCILDPETGLLMFQVMDKGCVHLEENARKSLKSATVKVQVGIFQGQEVSLWDLLFSRYILENKRKELLKQFKSGSITLQEMTQVLTSIIDEAEAKSKSKPIQMMLLRDRDRSRCSSEREIVEKILKSRVVMMPAGEFSGHKISVWDLLHSKYIPKGKRKELLKLFATGVLTVDQMEVVVTAIVAKVEEEKAKVLSAGQEDERGCESQETQAQQSLKLIQIPVTSGQFKGQNMSVLDLLFSKYFSREKRQELLELYGSGALSPKQMVEAVRSTLEKVEAGRKKFMIRIKGRSQEASGSKEVTAASSSSTSQPADDLLKAKVVTIPAGEFRGQQMSVWDLLFSQYITRDKGEELLRKYREGAFSVQEMASMLTILVSLHDLFSTLEKTAPRTGAKASSQGSLGPPTVSFEGEEEEEEEDEDDEDSGDEDQKKKDKVLKSRMVEVPVGEFAGRKVSLWDLLHSKYFPEKKRKEVLKLYRIGILSADQMETIITAVVTKLCEEKAKEDRHGSGPPCHCLKEAGAAELSVERPRERTVENLTFEFPVGEFQGRRVTVWDLLFSNYVSEAKRQELLTKYATGALNNQDLLAALTALITEAHSQRNMLSIPPLFPLLPREASYMMFGAPRASMQDLLCPQEQEAQNNGKVTYSEVTMTTTVVQGAEQKPE
ncbi:epiplakin [Vipera latastei]